MKFKVGDEVRVKDKGKCYLTMIEWLESQELPSAITNHYTGKIPNKHDIYNIIAVKYNQRYVNCVIYVLQDKNEDVYLIAERGIKKVKKSKNKDIKEIINYYGYEHQKIKAVEEMSELITEIIRGNEAGIMEEMADVQIMMKQLEISCSYPNKVKEIRKKKIERQLNRIEEEKEEIKKSEKQWNDFTTHIIEGGVSIEN